MKKLLIATALLVSACGQSESEKTLFKACADNIEAQAIKFDCQCQLDHFKAGLEKDELETLANFVKTEQEDPKKSQEIARQPEFEVIFGKIIEMAPAIEQDCRPKS